MKSKLLTVAAVLAGLLALGFSMGGCGKSIDAGHRGVYFNWRSGTDTKNVLDQGFHWLAPWNRIYIYDVRVKDQMEQLTVLSKDQLQIKTDISIRFRLVPAKVALLHDRVGSNFYRTLVQPVLRNALRDVVSRFTSIEAYRNRNKIQAEVQAAITPSLKKYDYFATEAIMLRQMEFPRSVVQAIERKLAMKQEADRETFKLDKAKIEAQRKIVEAQATAKAQAILKAELNDTLLRWKGIEATLQLAESKNAKVVVVGGAGDGLPLILGGLGRAAK